MKNLFWKLQSINASEKLEPESKEFKLYQKKFKKDFSTRELMSEAETIESYNFNAWKNAHYSKIYSLTLAYVVDNGIRVMYITGEEKDLIQTFLNHTNSEYFKEYQITHFDSGILLPYLGVRRAKNNIKTRLHDDLIYQNKRPWNLTGCSVRDYHQGAGDYKYNLEELADIYGIDCNFIESVDEFTFYKAEKFEELKNSAVDEIVTLVNVYRSMLEDTILELVNVQEQFVEKVEEVKSLNVLVELYETKRFSAEVQEKLKKLIKKPLKKEKTHLKQIVTAHYLERIDVMDNQEDKDSKTELNKVRTEEINQFIEGL